MQKEEPMTYSNNWLGIANRALVKTGNQQIESFTGGTDNVNYINTCRPGAVEAVAGIFPWRCLATRRSLAPSTEMPEFEYLYKYPLPEDFARLNSVDAGELKWEREGRAILTSSVYCNITYGRLPAEPDEISPALKELITIRLAYAIVQITTSNTTLMNQLAQEFNTALALAENEESQGEPDVTRFIGWAENR